MSSHFSWLLNRPICKLILRMWIDFGVENAFCDDILLLEKWGQKEEQVGALFALIFNFSKCHHKIVITKMNAQFFLATVKRPSEHTHKHTTRYNQAWPGITSRESVPPGPIRSHLRLPIFGIYRTDGLPVNLPVNIFLPEQTSKKDLVSKQSLWYWERLMPSC